MKWNSLRIYAADIGSISRGNFGWARAGKRSDEKNSDITTLVDRIAQDLADKKLVTLGLEAPMFVPVPEDHRKLGGIREVDPGNRAWSAGAGAPVLATAIVQLGWLVRTLTERVDNGWTDNVGVRWSRFEEINGPGLFLWEAMVTGPAKKGRERTNHNVVDAEAAAKAFDALKLRGVRKLDAEGAQITNSLSLIGAVLAANHVGGTSRSLITEAPIVVKA